MTILNSSKSYWILVFWVLLFWTPAPASGGELSVRQVFKNIFMVAPKGPEGSNSVFIITEEGVLVVDSGSSPDEAHKIIAEIRHHTIKPIRFLINTHYFGTHTFGNTIFRKEGAAIIGHKNVLRALVGKRGQLELQRLQKSGIPSLNFNAITPPNIIFEKGLEMVFGGHQILMIPPGPALTDGDLLVYLPDFKTVIAGGIVNNKVIPRLAESDWENWIKVLQAFDNYKAEIILPGSGPVGEKPTAIKMRHYLLDIKEQIQLQKGKSFKKMLETTSSFLKAKYSSWAKQDRIEGNIRKIYQDLLKRGTNQESQTTF
tara:strand:+ start:804 stop:1748 length:945 start_codon:yes stop_codon:yes gene_type:complete